MELKKLELIGFRGFKNKQVINFPKDRQPVIFVGINGAGKTSLLDAIRIAITPFYDRLMQVSLIHNDLKDSDINYEKDSAEVLLNWIYPIESIETGYQSGAKIGKVIGSYFGIGKESEFETLALDIRNKISLYKNEQSLAIVVHYPSQRLALELNVNDGTGGTFNHYSALRNALASAIDFKTFFRWFRLTEDIENEQRLTQDPTYTEPGLKAVRNAILAFLDNFTELRIQRSPVTDMVIKKEGKKLSVQQLSSGEKSLLTLVGDLARRLAIANPGLKNPLEGRGVVLIDEVDLHLHPTWQTKIVARLQKTFPNIQFILTTHSPLIINHLKPESVFFLKDNECYPAQQEDLITYGASIPSILAWQGVENSGIPMEIVDKINQIAQFTKDNKLDAAKEALATLKRLTNPIESEILNLETDIELKELDA